MKKLMLLALIAGASSVYAAAEVAGKEGQAEAQADDAPVAPKAPVIVGGADKGYKGNIKSRDWSKKPSKNFDQKPEFNTAVKKVSFFTKANNWRKDHPRIFFGGLTVVGLGIVGWIVNKFVVSKKEAKAEVATPELKAQEQIAAQFKPAVKA